MKPLCRCTWLLTVVGLLMAAGMWGQAPSSGEEKLTQKDALGDPLPEGALLRLGTARLRHGSFVAGVAFAPDGKTMASVGGDGVLRIWDRASGKETQRLRLQENQAEVINGDLSIAEEGSLAQVSYSPDGKLLAIAWSMNGSLRVLQADTLKEAFKAPMNKNGLPPVFTFSADSKTLVAGDGERTVRLYEVGSGKELKQFQGQGAGGMRAVALSKDGATLAVGENGSIRLWDVAGGKEIRKLRRHQGVVTTLQFSPDDRILASGSDDDNTIRLWDLSSGRQLREFNHPHSTFLDLGLNDVHEYGVSTTVVRFAKDGKTIFSAAKHDRFARHWETDSGKELAKFEGHTAGVTALTLDKEGKTLAIGGEDNAVRLFDLATGKEVLAPVGHRARIWLATYSSDGKRIFTSGRDSTVRAWDAATGKQLLVIGEGVDRFFGVSISPDGKRLATSRKDDEIITIWDLETGKELRQLTRQQTGVMASAFAPDNKHLASMSETGAITIWDVETGKSIKDLQDNQNQNDGVGFTTIAFSPDGKWLGTINGQGHIVIWDVGRGQIERRIDAQNNQQGLFRIAFAPDGKTIATAATDRTVCLWSPTTGKHLHKFDALGVTTSSGMMVWESIAYSTDGRLLSAINSEGGISVFEVATGKELRKFKGHQGWVCAMAMSPLGRTMMSGSLDTTGLVWDLTGVSPDGKLPLKDVTAKEMEQLWTDLAGDDPLKAYAALWTIVGGGKSAVTWLKDQLKPTPLVDQKMIAKLVQDLDSDKFNVRENATKELEKLGDLAAPELRKLLVDQTPLEVRRRVERLLEKLDTNVLTTESLRLMRTMTVLEQMRTPDSRQMLEALAKGAPGARQTEEAKLTLARLKATE